MQNQLYQSKNQSFNKELQPTTQYISRIWNLFQQISFFTNKLTQGNIFSLREIGHDTNQFLNRSNHITQID